MAESRHSRSARALGSPLAWLLAVAFLTFVRVADVAAQGYTLQPGDQIQISIVELPVPPAVSPVDMDGRVVFPHIGSFEARGKTLNALQEEISLAAAGKLVSVYSSTGERLQLALDGTGVFLTIQSYRPVYVTGDVAVRGPITFVPGMTVRTALATAGGASEVPLMFEDALLRAPEMQSRYESLATQHAQAVVGLWGIDATLAEDPDATAPETDDVVVPERRLNEFVNAERRNVAFELENTERRREFLTRQLGVLTDQIDRFVERLQNQETSLELEQERVNQVEALAGRGLAASTRLNDARQSFLSVSSSILDARSNLANLTLRREEIEQDLATLDFQQEGTLRAERSDLVPRVQTLSSELQAARRLYAMNGVVVDTAPQEPEIRFEIARTFDDGSVDTVAAELETPVRPGDVVEVSVRYPFGGAIIDAAPDR